MAVNLSSRPWAGTLDLPDANGFAEITPAVPLPQQPGGAVPPRVRRDDTPPAIGLDSWGFRMFRRATP